MKRKSKKQEILYFLPICLILAVVPYIVHQQVFRTYMENYSWIEQDRVYSSDLFLCAKGIVLCMIAVAMIALWVQAKAWKKDLYPETYPVIMYVILVMFSTLLSVDRTISVHGAEDQMESVFVLLSYIVVLIYCMYMIGDEQKVKWVQNVVLVTIFLMGTIGVLQMFRLDIFRTDIAQWLVTLGNGDSVVEFSTPLGMVYTTLYNQNYVGSFTGLFFPSAMCYAISTPKWKNKIIGMLAALLLLICTLGAYAKNAVISIGLGLILLVVIYRKKILLHLKKIVIALICGIVLMFGLNYAFDHAIEKVFQAMITALTTNKEYDHELQEIHTGDEELEIVLSEDTLHLQYFVNEDGTVSFIFQDADENFVDYTMDGTQIRLTKDTFSNIIIEPCMIDEVYGFSVLIDGNDWYFSNQVEDGTYYFNNYAGKYVKLEKGEEAVFTNCPNLFSGRGYIWAKTIPLLKKYFFIGSGPDTFQIVFPQNDYVDLTNKFAANMLVTRAHSMYLQTAVQTGVISLLCILALYIIYFVKGFMLYNRIFKSGQEITGTVHASIGFYVGTFSYMVSGLTNDSLPVTAPLFWCLLGCGIATNYLLDRKYPIEKQNSEIK